MTEAMRPALLPLEAVPRSAPQLICKSGHMQTWRTKKSRLEAFACTCSCFFLSTYLTKVNGGEGWEGRNQANQAPAPQSVDDTTLRTSLHCCFSSPPELDSCGHETASDISTGLTGYCGCAALARCWPGDHGAWYPAERSSTPQWCMRAHQLVACKHTGWPLRGRKVGSLRASSHLGKVRAVTENVTCNALHQSRTCTEQLRHRWEVEDCISSVAFWSGALCQQVVDNGGTSGRPPSCDGSMQANTKLSFSEQRVPIG